MTTVNNKISAANLFTAALDTTPEIEAYKGTAAAVIGRNFLTNITDQASTVPPRLAQIRPWLLSQHRQRLFRRCLASPSRRKL